MRLVSRLEGPGSEWTWFELSSCWFELLLGVLPSTPQEIHCQVQELQEIIVRFSDAVFATGNTTVSPRGFPLQAMTQDGATLSAYWSDPNEYATYRHILTAALNHKEPGAHVGILHYSGSPTAPPELLGFTIPGSRPILLPAAMVA